MNKQFFFICNGIHITIDRKTCTIKNIKVDEDQKFLYVNRIVFHNNNNHIQELYNIYMKKGVPIFLVFIMAKKFLWKRTKNHHQKTPSTKTITTSTKCDEIPLFWFTKMKALNYICM